MTGVSRYLAGQLTGEWLELARYLDIPEANLHDIRKDNNGREREAKYQMLVCWKQTKGRNANHNVLAGALEKAARKDLSDKVRDDENEAKTRPVEDDFSSEEAANWSSVRDGHITSYSKEKKAQFLKELRKKYKNLCGGIQPVPFLRDKYDIDQIYVENKIELLIETQGGRKDREKWKGIENYKQIFTDPQIKSNRRIIQGEPGFGKSILALQITHDWCQERSPMNKIDILILLRLRQFKNVPSVYSAIRKFLLPKDSKLTEVDIGGIIDSSSTVILFDGYDEYPDRRKEETDIGYIIREEMFQNHEIILTTRTSCLPPDYSRDTERFRLTGIDDNAKDTYIRDIVAGGNSEDAEKINQFLRENPVPAELCEVPLFFTMIAYMVHREERFLNLKTVTEFFRHMIKCFSTHQHIKVAREPSEKGYDHSALQTVAFEGLSATVQQISWGKDELGRKIGKKLYNEYVRIGILVEEEGYDYDAMAYKTETRFYHKMFVEWFAAHHLVKEAVMQETEFEPWLTKASKQYQAANRSQAQGWANENVHLLKSLDPNEVHYMYRYACGLNHGAALKIIDHFTKEKKYDQYTLLCITEWGGSLGKIPKTVVSICSRGIRFTGIDTSLFQKSAVELVKFASERKIPISKMSLYNCLASGLLSTGNLRVVPSKVSLPVIATLKELGIEEHGLKITQVETEIILEYAATCLQLKKIAFFFCLLPRFIGVTKSLSILQSKNVKVEWVPEAKQNLIYALRGWPSMSYFLNLKSGQWEYRGSTNPMTEAEYHRQIDNVRLLAEGGRKCEQKVSTTTSDETGRHK